MAMALDIKRTKFVSEVALCVNPIVAAKKAGFRANNAASVLLKDPEVIAAIEGEKAKIREVTTYTAAKAMLELDEALAMAKTLRDVKAVNSIIISRMKLNGLAPDRLQIEERPSLAAALDRKFAEIVGLSVPAVAEGLDE